jgi:hypothetical protein
MTPETFKEAEKLYEEKSQIRDALKIWEKELLAMDLLAYRQTWNGMHCTELPMTGASKAAFVAFREATIATMKNRLSEIDQELAAL